ncbi:MAG: hypothetical protein P9M11_00870, partial [Candidatus Tenebribacter burtonii]|nr:hypothetical protein [Candidatus Tenebribacter burtonii]
MKLIRGYKSWVSQQEFRGAIVIKSASAFPLLIWQIPFHFLSGLVEKKLPVTSVSAGRLGGLFLLNRTDSGFRLFVFGWNHSDSAAHAKH